MSDTQKKPGDADFEPSDEEKQEEEALLKEQKEDEIRAKIIEDYGFDEEADAEIIDKLVKKELDQRKIASKAIRQKIEWRERAKKTGTQSPPKETTTPPEKPKEDKSEFITREEFNKELQERDLKALNLPEELEKEIRDYVNLHKVSVKDALNSDYIKFRKEQIEKGQKALEARAGGKRKPSIPQEFNPEDPGEGLDLSTKEGQEEWERRKKVLQQKFS